MPFHQLVLHVDQTGLGAAERACSTLGALALTLGDAGDEPVLEPAPGATPLWREIRLQALFDAGANPALLAATLAATLGMPPASIEVESIADRVWERDWLKDFRPMRFGRRLQVSPRGERPAPPARHVLELEPGLAFGTGMHATTALCLEWLDEKVEDGLTVLDYGCGSGILALAALTLGASRATAADIDPQALIATRENARQNGLADRITVLAAAEAVAGSFELVVANILAQPLIELAALLAAHCQPGGHLALSGMLERDAREVAAAYRPWFDIRIAAEREGWTLLAGGRRVE